MCLLLKVPGFPHVSFDHLSGLDEFKCVSLVPVSDYNPCWVGNSVPSYDPEA